MMAVEGFDDSDGWGEAGQLDVYDGGGVSMTYGDGVISLSWEYLTTSSPTDSMSVFSLCASAL